MKRISIIEDYCKEDFINQINVLINDSKYKILDIQYKTNVIGNLASIERLHLYTAYITMEDDTYVL